MSVWSDQTSHHKDNRILLLSTHLMLVGSQGFKRLMSVPSFLPSTHSSDHLLIFPCIHHPTQSFVPKHPSGKWCAFSRWVDGGLRHSLSQVTQLLSSRVGWSSLTVDNVAVSAGPTQPAVLLVLLNCPHASCSLSVSCLLIGYGNRGRWEETKPCPL